MEALARLDAKVVVLIVDALLSGVPAPDLRPREREEGLLVVSRGEGGTELRSGAMVTRRFYGN